MANTPKKFSMQQVFEVLLRDPETKKIIAYIDTGKTSGLENTVELVYPTGGQGNVYVGGAWAHSRRAKLNLTDAIYRTEVMAAQNGTEIVEDDADVIEYEVITVGASNKGATTYTAKGTAGSEIGYAYVINENGDMTTQLTQDQSASSGKFAYASSTKELTFHTDIAEGTKIALAYTRATTGGAQRLTLNTDAIPKTALVTAFGVAMDTCNGELFKAQIDGYAQIDGNWNLDVTADGEPVSQNLALEFIKRCGTKKLYDFTVYTDEE